MLKPCYKCNPHGQEKSVVTKIYHGNKRVEYCINKGCGYRQELPPIRRDPDEEDISK